MRFALSQDSCVRIDLRASGLLRSVAHDPTLVARPGSLVVTVPDGPLDVPVHATFRADAIEPPSSLSPSDQERMRGHLLGRDVLDARRFPTIEVRGRYRGTAGAGRSVDDGVLVGVVVLRGAQHPIELSAPLLPAQMEGGREHVQAAGQWEGKLTQLGVAPFTVLFGALRLDDWIRLRLDARFYLER